MPTKIQQDRWAKAVAASKKTTPEPPPPIQSTRTEEQKARWETAVKASEPEFLKPDFPKQPASATPATPAEPATPEQPAEVPTTPEGEALEHVVNEEALQEKRDELAKLGIPKDEWDQYILPPDENGRIFFKQPLAPTSAPALSAQGGQHIPNEEALQQRRTELGKLGIQPSEWGNYITKGADGKLFYNPPTEAPEGVSGLPEGTGEATEEGISAEQDYINRVNSLLEAHGVGIPDLNQSPVSAFTETYNQLYEDMGLDTIADVIKELTSEVEALDNELAEEIQTVNDNPWTSEALRTKKIASATQKINSKKDSVVNRLQLQQSLFNAGQEEARFVAEMGVTLSHRNEDLQRDIIFKAMENVEKEKEAQRELARVDPSNFKSVQGGLYDIKNDEWVVPPKGAGGGGAGGGFTFPTVTPQTPAQKEASFQEFLEQKRQEVSQQFTPQEIESRRLFSPERIEGLRQEFEFQQTTADDTPITATDIDVLTAQLGKQVYGTRIANEESARIERIIQGTLKSNPGITVGDLRESIMRDLFGYDPQQNQGLGDSLIQSVMQSIPLADFDMFGLSRLLNADNTKGAITKVENAIMGIAKNENPDDFIGESTVRTANTRSNEIINLLGEDSPVGVVSGTMEEWLGRLKGKEATELRSKIISQVAEMRNRLSGTAVTESEERFLEPLIPKISDRPDNFVAKLNQLKDMPLVQLNGIRETYGLPQISESQLLNKSLRTGLYGGQVQQGTQLTDEQAYQEYLKTQ